MAYSLFITASSIEYFSLFVFMLSLFRFRLKEKIIYVIFISFIMSQVSYFTRLVPEIGSASSYLQYALSIIVLLIVFRVPLFYSVIMNASAVAFGLVAQGAIILVLWLGFDVSLSSMQENAVIGSAVQILSSVIFLAASRTVHTFNLGFDFVPTSYRSYKKITRTSAILISTITVVFAVACVAAFLFRNEYEDYIIVQSAIFVVTLPVFLYYCFRKDLEDAQ